MVLSLGTAFEATNPITIPGAVWASQNGSDQLTFDTAADTYRIVDTSAGNSVLETGVFSDAGPGGGILWSSNSTFTKQ